MIKNLASDKRQEKILNVLSHRQVDLTIVLENINDPHNFSAVLRSCDAVGILEVYAIYPEASELPEFGAKSSASARKWVEVRLFNSIDECYAALRAKGMKIYTTHLSKESKSLYDLNLSEPTALVFGNEHDGVSDEAVAKSDGNFLIPQFGMIQSLNISVACAVSIYEACRQRIASGKYHKLSLAQDEFENKALEWLIK